MVRATAVSASGITSAWQLQFRIIDVARLVHQRCAQEIAGVPAKSIGDHSSLIRRRTPSKGNVHGVFDRLMLQKQRPISSMVLEELLNI